MAQRFATRIGPIRVNRFAEKPLYFHKVRAIRASVGSNLRLTIFGPTKRDSQKKGVWFGKPETIRENQAIRANLRIDSRESGHLSCKIPWSF